MSQGKRGKPLEEAVIKTNDTYKEKGLALVDKVPTPWNVDYRKPKSKGGKPKVESAFPMEKGTVDFVGISHGRGIAFDAKSTTSRTSFPLANIKEHQKDYLLQFKDQGGIAFMIIEFSKLREHYFLKIEDLEKWWNNMERGGRKSIPHKWFMLHCDLIKSRNGILLDYLRFCNTAYKRKKVAE